MKFICFTSTKVQYICFTSTKVQILTPEELREGTSYPLHSTLVKPCRRLAQLRRKYPHVSFIESDELRYSIYLLYQYNSTNTDAQLARP